MQDDIFIYVGEFDPKNRCTVILHWLHQYLIHVIKDDDLNTLGFFTRNDPKVGHGNKHLKHFDNNFI